LSCSPWRDLEPQLGDSSRRRHHPPCPAAPKLQLVPCCGDRRAPQSASRPQGPVQQQRSPACLSQGATARQQQDCLNNR
jgi:hypothetical protein